MIWLRRKRIRYPAERNLSSKTTSKCANVLDRYFRSIQALESDMAAIRAEHEHQNKAIQDQKSALDRIIGELGSLRFLGKERDSASIVPTPRDTPAPEGHNTEMEDGSERATSAIPQNMGEGEEQEEGEADKLSEALTGTGLNDAREDIEMGEVEEDPKDKSKRRYREELEEGEASDTSSALSEPPDD